MCYVRTAISETYKIVRTNKEFQMDNKESFYRIISETFLRECNDLTEMARDIWSRYEQTDDYEENPDHEQFYKALNVIEKAIAVFTIIGKKQL
jgi:hypothetical protein